jgi:hypothetical protein
MCTNAGITLISIPYWWNEQLESLVATIRKYRPGNNSTTSRDYILRRIISTIWKQNLQYNLSVYNVICRNFC